MKKVSILIITILCCFLVSCENKVELDSVDAISGIGYDGYKKLIEDFNNNELKVGKLWRD